MYRLLIRPFVRSMELEQASRVALRYYKIQGLIPGGRWFNRLVHRNRPCGLEREVFGLNFYNPIGLGAGLDRSGDLYDDLDNLGFSFVEIGPLNAKSTRHAINNLQNDPQDDILAACINADYTTSFSLAYDFCDFFVIELPKNRSTDILDNILDIRLTDTEYKPVVAKIPESSGIKDLEMLVDYCLRNGVDGIEARSLEQIKAVCEYSKGRLPVIANCHINSPEEAQTALEAGASLIELRSGIVYQGPRLVRRILKHLESIRKNG